MDVKECASRYIGLWELDGNGRGRPVVRSGWRILENGHLRPDGTGYWVDDDEVDKKDIWVNGCLISFVKEPPHTGNSYHWDNAVAIELAPYDVACLFWENVEKIQKRARRGRGDPNKDELRYYFLEKARTIEEVRAIY